MKGDNRKKSDGNSSNCDGVAVNSMNFKDCSDMWWKRTWKVDGWIVSSFVVLVRLILGYTLRTSFVPDEYWQADEVAHRMAFGYGYLTWEWTAALRGALHPSLFASAFYILKIFQLDTPNLIAIFPRMIQALFVVVGDVSVYHLARKWFPHERGAASLSLLATLFSWFIAYCSQRTLSSALEACLLPLALSLMTEGDKIVISFKKTESLFGWLVAAITCLIRPTAAITWVGVVVVFFVQTYQRKRQQLSLILWNAFQMLIGIGLLSLFLSISLDYLFYNKLEIVQWNFLHFNVLSGGASFFGEHPWYWYWVQGMFVVFGLWYPFLVLSFCISKENMNPKWPLVLGFTYVALFSVLKHKEFRFILPALYLCLPHIGHFLHKLKKSKYYVAVWILLFVNIPVIAYMNRVHQGAPEQVMATLREEYKHFLVPTTTKCGIDILFLTDCHSTPFYSQIHQNVHMVFPECAPPEFGNNERELFHKHPQQWISSTMEFHDCFGPSDLPMFAVAFRGSPISDEVEGWLHANNYSINKCFFHAHALSSDHDGHRMCLYKHFQ
eukprot:m.47532 g.47532  ORF g.47532 m.47532 type:complete len:553 (-) comp7337_c0_seq2:167-1825(-)